MPEKPKLAVTPKVVHLDSDSNQSIRAGLARLPAPVHALHEKGKLLIAASLSRFFDEVDDSLFELADKASNNQDQNIYFDSMREIRVQRRGVERAFARAIDEAFATLMVPEASRSGTAPEDSLTSNTLSLISNEDLEEMVAVDSTVSRASRELAEPIQHLSLRLDSLVPSKVYEKNNPLGPRLLCGAFTQQVKGLDVDIKVKLVLFKLFDRMVIAGLKEVYDSANRLLIDHNVLPTFASQTSTPPSQGAVQPGHPPSMGVPGQPMGAQAGGQANTEVLNVLKQLFGERLVAEATPQEQIIAGNELMALLSLAQRAPVVQTPVNPGQPTQAVGDVRVLLGEIEKQSGIRADIGRVDDEVINLVNMLFEFILQDKNLSAPMKTLISRLQIPIVKVALIDKTFFTKGGHAARRLLNEMATAALGWQGDKENEQDPLYNKIEHIVTRLLHDFDSDVSIFSELLADFTAFMENERRRSAVMERRTLDAEDGKARAEMARKTVNLEVELRLVDRRLPKIALKLIDEAWSNVMFVLALKHGFDSREWQTALHTLDDLLWSVATPETAEDRKTLIKLVPDLLKRLRTGFDTISFNPFEMSKLFKSLEEVHLACIRGTKLAPELMAPILSTPLAEPHKVSLEKAAPEEEAENVHVSEESIAEAPVEQLPDDDVHMQQVKNFVQGAWFEYRVEAHEMTRCRLAAYIRPTGKYIFVNRNGMKVAENSQQDLALALKQGNIRPLDNSMLFDRALETVVSSLRKNPKL